jgi:Ca2+-binding EF-hand superfamily protein
MPALKCLQLEKKKVLAGSRRPKATPWIISNQYQERHMFESLIRQREEARNAKPVKMGKKKRTKKKVAEDEAAPPESESETDEDSPEGKLGKERVKALQAVYTKFDKHDNGWVDVPDLPVIIATHLGSRNPPEALTMQAVKQVTDYRAVEFAEFVQAMAIFVDLEHEQLKTTVVEEYGENAMLGVDEARSIMAKFGEDVFPWAVGEAIGGDDETTTIKVDVDGFIKAFHELRLRCGFTVDETEEMMDVFDKFDQDLSGNISAEEFARVLKYMGFNPPDEMVAELIRLADSDQSGEIDKDEFPGAMRIYTELQTKQFRRVFESFDMDGSGSMDTNEVYDCVKMLGWFPTEETIQEAVEEVDKDGTGEISFDEFFSLMKFIRKTEGFTKGEREQLHTLFSKFDIDGSGEISTLELSAALRAIGYPTSLTVLQNLVQEVDVDGSGEIDEGEFFKLIRKYKNREMMECEKLYEKWAVHPEEEGMSPEEKEEHLKNLDPRRSSVRLQAMGLDRSKLAQAVKELGWSPSDMMLEKIEAMASAYHGKLSWKEFTQFIKSYRALELTEFNKRAGFSEEEVDFYRSTFGSYDKDGGGQLTLQELFPLLTELGKEPKTVIQRDKLTAILAEIDEDGSGEIDFSEFLQLMRRFLDESDAEALLKEKEMVKRTKFEPEEVTQWRDIFIKFDSDGSGSFDPQEGKVLLQAVGINLNERAMHDRYISLFNEVDEDDDGCMDFPEFLFIMRKLLDIDFGGLASRTAPKEPKEKTVNDKKKEARAAKRAATGGGEPEA